MAVGRKPKCKPVYDPDMLETCDGTHIKEGKPCKKCTDEKWPTKRGPNPCCAGQEPPKREDYPDMTDDQFGRLTDLWYEFRDQYCPVYVDQDPKPDPKPDPPKPDPKPDPPTNFGTGGVMSNYNEVGGDRSMEMIYGDRVPGPFGTGNWAL